MSVGRRVLVTLCGLIAFLLAAQNAIAAETPWKNPGFEGGTGSVPDACIFEEGDLGSYIVVLHDWVEDPEPVARDQVDRYGGNLGFLYKSALKGYSAEYPPAFATVLQAEPTVKYVEVNRLIWMDDSSGVIQWRSCPLAPPLGPKPPAPLPPPTGPGLPDVGAAPAEVAAIPQAPALGIATSGAPGTRAKPPAKRCSKRGPKKSKQARTRCGRRHTQPKRATGLSSLFGGVEQSRHQLN